MSCLTCTFRASRCSARLFLRRFLCPGQGKKRAEGVRRTACNGGYKGVWTVRSEPVAGGRCFEVLCNLECPVRLSQKRNMCAFQWRKFGTILNYVVRFEFRRSKVAQIGPSGCWVVSLGCPCEPWKGPDTVVILLTPCKPRGCGGHTPNENEPYFKITTTTAIEKQKCILTQVLQSRDYNIKMCVYRLIRRTTSVREGMRSNPNFF